MYIQADAREVMRISAAFGTKPGTERQQVVELSNLINVRHYEEFIICAQNSYFVPDLAREAVRGDSITVGLLSMRFGKSILCG